MNIKIPYGSENQTISVPASYELLMPKKVSIRDETTLIKKALQHPFGMDSFSSFAKKSDRLLVIVNDATRPTPTAKVLQFLHETLSNHPDVTFLVATGVHRAPTEEEYRFIFGNLYENYSSQIVAHDAHNDQEMKYLGRSSNGTEMYINKLVPELKNVVCIGSVEPHYFAGYTGGRKSFLPGVASYETIEMNHKLALSDRACSLALKGNPVHEDMVDAMNVLSNLNVFSIQTVLTGEHNLYAVTAGDLHQSFDAAIQSANEIFCVTYKKKANIVLSVAPYPMDIDLYQSQKALDNAQHAIEDDGIIILISKCRMGVGEDAFLDLLCQADTPQKILKMIGDEYKLGYHKAAKMAQMGTQAHLWAVTDLADDVIQKALMKPYHSIQTALDDALQLVEDQNKKPHVIIMPAGSLTIPSSSQK